MNETILKNFLSGPLGEALTIIRESGKLYSDNDDLLMDRMEKTLIVKASAYIRMTVHEKKPELSSDDEIIRQFDSILQTVLHTGQPCHEET